MTDEAPRRPTQSDAASIQEDLAIPGDWEARLAEARERRKKVLAERAAASNATEAPKTVDDEPLSFPAREGLPSDWEDRLEEARARREKVLQEKAAQSLVHETPAIEKDRNFALAVANEKSAEIQRRKTDDTKEKAASPTPHNVVPLVRDIQPTAPAIYATAPATSQTNEKKQRKVPVALLATVACFFGIGLGLAIGWAYMSTLGNADQRAIANSSEPATEAVSEPVTRAPSSVTVETSAATANTSESLELQAEQNSSTIVAETNSPTELEVPPAVVEVLTPELALNGLPSTLRSPPARPTPANGVEVAAQFEVAALALSPSVTTPNAQLELLASPSETAGVSVVSRNLGANQRSEILTFGLAQPASAEPRFALHEVPAEPTNLTYVSAPNMSLVQVTDSAPLLSANTTDPATELVQLASLADAPANGLKSVQSQPTGLPLTAVSSDLAIRSFNASPGSRSGLSPSDQPTILTQPSLNGAAPQKIELVSLSADLPLIGAAPEQMPKNFVGQLGLSAADLERFGIYLFAPSSIEDGSLADYETRLSDTGLSLKTTRRVDFKISKTQIRYYNQSDETLAKNLADELGIIARDFTANGGGHGRIEVWMQGTAKTAPKPKRTVRTTTRTRTIEKPVDMVNRLTNSIIQQLRTKR